MSKKLRSILILITLSMLIILAFAIYNEKEKSNYASSLYNSELSINQISNDKLEIIIKSTDDDHLLVEAIKSYIELQKLQNEKIQNDQLTRIADAMESANKMVSGN